MSCVYHKIHGKIEEFVELNKTIWGLGWNLGGVGFRVVVIRLGLRKLVDIFRLEAITP